MLKQSAPYPWPIWYRIAFRFFFIYFTLYLVTTSLAGIFPFLPFFGTWQDSANNWTSNYFNAHVWHFYDELVPTNGSGDTSMAWVQLVRDLCLAALGTLIWSLAARRRTQHYRMEYLLRTALRYFLAFYAFIYGSIKIIALQMPFPRLSQMATPLGDLLPMRFSWLFIGYSPPYQVFCGIAEILVFALLLYRKTVTLGLSLATGVFLNVMMLNLCYDVPVKLFSTHLFLISALLLLNELPRLADFFIFNRPAGTNTLYHFQPTKKPGKILRIGLKIYIVILCGLSVYDVLPWYHEVNHPKALIDIPEGIYDVTLFVEKGDTIPQLARDTLAWKDIIFENGSDWISTGSTDPRLALNYRRGNFFFKADTLKRRMECYRFKQADSIHLFTLHYQLKGDTIDFFGDPKDSLRIQAVRSGRKFKLAERQFHWLSERNR